jgi:hypothetical protein
MFNLTGVPAIAREFPEIRHIHHARRFQIVVF